MKRTVGYVVKYGPLYRMPGYNWSSEQKKAFVYSDRGLAEMEAGLYVIGTRVVKLVKTSK